MDNKYIRRCLKEVAHLLQLSINFEALPINNGFFGLISASEASNIRLTFSEFANSFLSDPQLTSFIERKDESRDGKNPSKN